MTDAPKTDTKAAKPAAPSKPRDIAKPVAASETAPAAPVAKAAVKKAPVKKAAVKTASAKKPVAKAAPKKSATKKPVAKKAAPKPAAAKKTNTAAAAPAAQAKVGIDMNQTLETMTTASNEAVKEGFEKTLSAVNDASKFHKETVDAIIESATVTGKGIETVNSNAVAYAKSAMEESVAVTKAVASAKSVQEIFEIQSDYAKSAMDTYLSELNKTSELFSDLMKNSVKPINDRVSAAIDLAQSQR